MTDLTPTSGTTPVPPAAPTAQTGPPTAPPVQPGPPATPPVASAPAAPSAPARRRWPVAVAVVGALLVGGGIGYAAGMPQRSSLQDDKAALQKDLGSAKKDLAAAEKELASAKAASTAKDVCVTAATDAGDYISQVDNFFTDMGAYFNSPEGSAAEAQLDLHMTEQEQKMQQQYERVESELKDCTAALKG